MLATCLAAVFSLMTRCGRDLPVGLTGGDEAKDLHLAGRQAARRCIAGIESP